MTKEEIKALIAEKISGQGTAVDVGGALALILNELADAGGGSAEIPVSELEYNDEDSIYVYKSGKTHAEAMEILTSFGLLYIKAVSEADGAEYYGLASCNSQQNEIFIGGTNVRW